MSEFCEHETFKDICGICHRDTQITARRTQVERLRARIREWEEARAALKGETSNRTQEDIESDRQAVLNRMRALIGSTAPRADFEWQQLQHKLQDLMVESWSILPLPQEASDE